MSSVVDDLLKLITGLKDIPEPGSARARMAARQQCSDEGHRYQVHGRYNPNKVACSRCKVSWAIGPRTEHTV